jgi:(1->4)-alpha-D-glucan 1-alpha-D-glucosylmutase
VQPVRDELDLVQADTALYRFNRLVSLNEVGSEPDAYGAGVAAFHADARYRAQHWPHEMLATSTHDTKRSEDVRARIGVLSELPALWRQAVERWRRMNRTRRRTIDGAPAPSPDEEYLFYQTLIGTWPLDAPDEAHAARYRERIEAYMLKAAREAKIGTSWSNVDTAYEDALTQFARAALEPRDGNVFLADFCAFERRIVRFGLLNGLTQTLLKLTAPGVPDIYQGNELWDFSLVDPDNRRPVDYAMRASLLEELSRLAPSGATARRLAERLEDPRCKLFLHRQALRLRGEREALFTHGSYVPLKVVGERAQHLCAYARALEDRMAVVVAPRLYYRLMAGRDGLPLGAAVWSDTVVELPGALRPSLLRNVFDGEDLAPRLRDDGAPVLPVAQVLQSFPVGLLAA